jgi:hypothetical protein
MLSPDTWGQDEPRLNFPVFAGVQNHVDFTLQAEPGITPKRLAVPLYHFLKGRKPFKTLLRDYRNLFSGEPYRFRGVYLDRQGQQLLSAPLPGEYKSGGFFHSHLNQWLQDHGVPLVDGNLILIANRGRADRFSSSPGNVTLRIVADDGVCGFRTGFFSRPLNAGHKHFGFTGLNPHVESNERWVSSILLINHSSDPAYDRRVTPTVRLHRSTDEFLEAPFGEIAPHAALERTVDELFPEARDYLASNAGRGYTITRLKGATLASIHIFRTREGRLASMEHSRPAHPNIVDYL